jgi:hypothetical protein
MIVLTFIRDLFATAGKFILALIALLILLAVSVVALVFQLIASAPM